MDVNIERLTDLESQGLRNTELVGYEDKTVTIIDFAGNSFQSKLISVGKDRITVRLISEDEETNNTQLDLHFIGVGEEGRETLKVRQVISEQGEVLFNGFSEKTASEGIELEDEIQANKDFLIQKLLTPSPNVFNGGKWKIDRTSIYAQCVATRLFTKREVKNIITQNLAEHISKESVEKPVKGAIKKTA